jgi:hypothetical protein
MADVYRKEKADAVRLSKAADYAKHKESYKARANARYAAKKEAIQPMTAEYQRVNKDKKSLWNAKYGVNNRHVSRINNANRKAARLNATPAWANLNAIKAMYLKAQKMTAESGISYHVDHIVPLQSALVCGFHCEANMEVITGSANSAKRNWHWPDMPSDEKQESNFG